MANFLTLLLALFAMTAFGESFCDRREGENEERERVADQRRAVFSVCMSFLDSFATCRRAGSRRQSACRRQPLSPFFFLSSPPSTLLHTHKQKNSRHPRRRLVQVSKEEIGALSLHSLIFSFHLAALRLLSLSSSLTQRRPNLEKIFVSLSFRGWRCGAGRGVAGAAVGTAAGVGIGYAVANNQNNNCYNSEW